VAVGPSRGRNLISELGFFGGRKRIREIVKNPVLQGKGERDYVSENRGPLIE